MMMEHVGNDMHLVIGMEVCRRKNSDKEYEGDGRGSSNEYDMGRVKAATVAVREQRVVQRVHYLARVFLKNLEHFKCGLE